MKLHSDWQGLPQDELKQFIFESVDTRTCCLCGMTVVVVRKRVSRCRCGVYRWDYGTGQWDWSSRGDVIFDWAVA